MKRTKIEDIPMRAKSRGLGDTIEKFTKATGIKTAVDTLTKSSGGCGCNKRKDTLNRVFPYKNK